jgi:hypothetical protein
MDKVLAQIGFAVAGAVGGLMMGNAGQLAESTQELTPIQYAMRYMKGDMKRKLLSLNRVRRYSDRMHWCMQHLTDNLLQLVALHQKVNTPQMPVSMRWGNVAQDFFVEIQDVAQEMDATLYLQKIEGFFKIRDTLMSIVSESKTLAGETADRGEKMFMAVLRDPQQPAPPKVSVEASIRHREHPRAHHSVLQNIQWEPPTTGTPPLHAIEAE